MDTKALHCFIVLYRLKNMHKAAEELFISQQGLSKIIRNLESEWEVLLFERSKYGMHPTKAGDYFYQHADSIENELEQMKREIKNTAGGMEELCIACAYGTLHILYPYLQSFRKQNPSVRIRWKEYPDRDADCALKNRVVEVAFCVEGSGQESFEHVPLAKRRILLLVHEGHRLWDRKSAAIADLKNEKIIVEGDGFHIFSLLQKKCLEEGFYPDIAAETAEINLCQNLCRMGEGVSITVDFIADISRLPGVRAIPFSEPDFTWNIIMAWRKKDDLTDTAKKFVQFIQDSLQASPL